MANQDHLAILNRGVSVWNEWIRSNPDIIPDLRDADLRGLDLSEIDLSKADLSNTDIQGTNFTKAILRGVNFSYSKAGIKGYLETSILARVPVLFSSLSGLLAVSSIWSLASYLIPVIQLEGQVFVSLFLTVLTLMIVIARFLDKESKGRNTVTFLMIACLPIYMYLTLLGNAAIINAFFDSLQIIVSIVAGAILLIISFTLGNGPSSLSPFQYVTTVNLIFFASLILDVNQSNDLSKDILETDVELYVKKFIFAVFVGIALSFVYRLIAVNFLKSDNEFSRLLRNGSTIFWTSRGTFFRKADLTGANFYKADLVFTDFREATLDGACWKEAENLFDSKKNQNQGILIDRVRTEGTILVDPDVRELLVTANGRGKNLCGKNLKGTYLVEADLSESDLSEADLSEANLEGANLEKANLTKTQALGTNLRAAKFTGVSGLKSWNRNDNTVLDDVDCMYVYLNTSEQERYPHNRDFETGEFTKLFQEVKNTIELIFRDGIDWKAFAYAFNETNTQIYNASGQRLSLRKYEVLDDGLIRLEIVAPPDMNLEKTRIDLEINYARLEGKLESIQNERDNLLNERDNLLNMLYTSKQGDTYNIGQSNATGRYARSDNNT